MALLLREDDVKRLLTIDNALSAVEEMESFMLSTLLAIHQSLTLAQTTVTPCFDASSIDPDEGKYRLKVNVVKMFIRSCVPNHAFLR